MATRSLKPEQIVAAYCRGIFPMADEESGEIGWYSPDPRAIFPLERFHVPRSLRRTIRQEIFEVRIDTAFEEVMRGCADRDETWISEELLQGYLALHRHGLAHSVEAWYEGELAGGLYGVALGGAFMGESMFTRVTDASKVCLAFLVERLRERGYVLLDSQLPSEHLSHYGQIVVSRASYMQQLAKALELDRRFT